MRVSKLSVPIRYSFEPFSLVWNLWYDPPTHRLLFTQAALSKSLSSPVCIGGYPLLGGGIKVVSARIVFVRRTEIDLVLAESSEEHLILLNKN